jgi:peptide-methionine (S)-S-oxide reductase
MKLRLSLGLAARVGLAALAGLAALVVATLTSFATAEGGTALAKPPGPGLAVATFAGGCFWCMEPPYDKTPGVVSTTSGYTGGSVAHATYRQVSAGGTGHTEAVRVVYDPKKVSYATLLDVFWRNIDPVDAYGQFCDKGDQYKPAIFYHDEEQKRLAEESKAALERSGRFKQPITVAILPAGDFYEAEDYHQDYYLKNPVRYKFYRHNCGRDARLEQVWGSAPTH